MKHGAALPCVHHTESIVPFHRGNVKEKQVLSHANFTQPCIKIICFLIYFAKTCLPITAMVSLEKIHELVDFAGL